MRYIQQHETSDKIRLDEKDGKILRGLARNARATYTMLGRQCRVSRDAVRYRITKLAEEGIIQGFRAVINMHALGYESFHCFLQFRSITKEQELQFRNMLKQMDGIAAVIKYTGKYDYELALHARTNQECSVMMAGILRAGGSFFSSDVHILTGQAVHRVFPRSFGSVEPDRAHEGQVAVDEKDILILKSISRNAREPFYQLGPQLGMSHDSVLQRVRRLEKEGVILNYVPVINYAALGYDVHAVLLSTLESEKVLNHLRLQKHVLWATTCLGKYDVLCYLCIEKTEQLHETILELRNVFGITQFETMPAYEEYKYAYL
ncbi:MAG: Lrp/AsnC family transcriptional regulator [archaeon]